MVQSLLHNLQVYRKKLIGDQIKNPLDIMRFYTYVVTTLMVAAGCILHFTGLLGVRRPVLLSISFTWGCIDGIIFLLFLSRRIKLPTAFVSCAISSQFIESVRILYLSITQTITYQQFYINELICISILLLVIMGFFYRAAFVLTLVNFIPIIACLWIIPNIVNSMTICFFILLDICLFTYCFASAKFVKYITMENEEVRGKYRNFLSFMRMNDTEATSLIQLVRSAFDDEKHVEMLAEKLGDETKLNILNLAHVINKRKKVDAEKIKKVFPQFSPTEVTVCQLVMAGHTQKDIARILDKTESNVSTVRGNIRRKLGLETNLDLREYLMNNLDEKA